MDKSHSEVAPLPVWPSWPPPRDWEPTEEFPRWLFTRIGDVTREEWEIPYIERVRSLNQTIRGESPAYQKMDSRREPTPPFGIGPSFRGADEEYGLTQKITLSEEPTIENIRELDNRLSKSEKGPMGVNCTVDWQGGLPYGFDYRFPEDDWPANAVSNPAEWEIEVEAFYVHDGRPWHFNGEMRIDGHTVYRYDLDNDGLETPTIVTDDDLDIMEESERTMNMKILEAKKFIFSQARESGLVFDEEQVKENLELFRENYVEPEVPHMHYYRVSEDWKAARSKAEKSL